MDGRRIAGAVVVVVGVATVVFALTRTDRSGAPATDATNQRLDRVAAEIDRKLVEGKAAVGARSQTLAQLPRLAPAVATDAATVAGLTTTELAFTLQAERGEVVELGQRPKAGGPAVSLLRLPGTAAATPHLDRLGTHTGVVGSNLVVTVVSEVTPSERADEIVGVLAVTWNVDVSSQRAELEGAGVAARLETENGPLMLGRDPGTEGTINRALSVGGAQLVATAPTMSAKGGGQSILWLGLAALAVGTIVVLWPRSQRQSAGAAVMQPPQGPEAFPSRMPTPVRNTPMPHAITELSGMSGDPSSRITAQNGMLGRYQLLRQLGAGGMAEVYLAKVHGEAGFSKQVAVKVMHTFLAGRQSALDHFLDEARLASQLSHPNIAQIIDLGRVENDYFIAMEYVEGTDLERALAELRRRGELVPVDVGLAIVRRVCDGLDFAHRAVDAEGRPLGLVHRDVKSANVLVSRQGEVKIVDFGIAKAATQVHVTQLGETKGTPSLMAPEQRMGQLVDARADVYSVAAMAYEVLCGVEVNLDVIFATQRGIEGWPHLAPPSTVRRDLPRELDTIILGALAWEPDQRPASCSVLEEALARVAKALGPTPDDKDIARWLATAAPAHSTSSAAS